VRAADEDELRSGATVRERELKRCSCCEDRGDAGDDFRRDVGFAKCVELFRGATEDEWIAALEAHDAEVAASGIDHQFVNTCLRDARASAALAHAGDEGVRVGHLNNRVGDQIVVEDDVCRGEKARGFEREEVGVARACSY
jgi:hypothetical protein